MQDRTACLVCDNQEFSEYITTNDFFGAKEEFSIIKCTKCHTLYTSPFPDVNQILTYYKSNSYVSHGDKRGIVFDNLYKALKSLNIRYKYKTLTNHVKTKSHLDIGCGTGDFLDYLDTRGIRTLGVEKDHQARTISLNKNLTVKNSISEIKEIMFDSISMIHVLEHVDELHDTLQFITQSLNKQGILYLALPNYLAYDAQIYHKYWAGFEVPRHLHHFSPKSIKTLSTKYGLKLVRSYPMKLDSYYISLLSHQYQTGRTNYLKALYNGYRSNQKAKQSGNYSSLIYILQK